MTMAARAALTGFDRRPSAATAQQQRLPVAGSASQSWGGRPPRPTNLH